MIVLWNLMNLRDNEQNLCIPQTMRITFQVKDVLRWHLAIWCTSFFLCHKRWKFWMQKLPWTRNGGSSREFQHGIWSRSRARKRYFWKHKRDKCQVHFATLMDICLLKKIGVGTQIAGVQRQSRAPGRHCKRRLWSLRSLHWTRLVLRPRWLLQK